MSPSHITLAPACAGMTGQRALKAAAVLFTLGYGSLLVYQGGVTFNSLNFQDNRASALFVTDLILDADKTSVNDKRTKNITLDDIFISVKTSNKHSKSRLPVIIKTWFQLAKNQTWFFTDEDNDLLSRHVSGHLVNTHCGSTHHDTHLCCKMSVEYDTYLASDKKWFCHFDDDNYVNVPQLLKTLQRYNHKEDWYLGRNSVTKPFRVLHGKVKFWFATGGAGFCISKSLGLKISPVTSGGRFMSQCKKILVADDVTMGYIIEILANTKLTVEPRFHSHLEQLEILNLETFQDQISFGYKKRNVIKVPGFDEQFDPTRFLSLHCFLFPHVEFCPR